MRSDKNKHKKAIRNDSTPPQGISIIAIVIISTFLGMGFPWMAGSALAFDVEVVSLCISSAFAAAAFAFLHSAGKKWLSVSLLVVIPLFIIIAVLEDAFLLQSGFRALLYNIKEYCFAFIPGTYYRSSFGLQAVTTCLEAINLINLNITAYVLIRRRKVWIPLFLYAPHFAIAVANINLLPSEPSVITAITGVFLLLLANVMRNKERITAERSIVRMTVPVLILTMAVGIIFPKEGYDKDQLAANTLIKINKFAKTIDEASDGHISTFINRAVHGGSGNIPGESPAALFASYTDLAHTGPFDPPSYRLFTSFKSTNTDYTGDAEFYGGNYMYFRFNSMDTYSNNLWSAIETDIEAYDEDLIPDPAVAQYTVTLRISVPSELDILPLYTDHFIVRGIGARSTYVNPYTFSDEGRTEFFCSPVPLRTGNIYTEEYLNDYVYGTNLEVPDSTREAILNSGVLPDWYIEAYNGTSAMSDADKVRAVTDFVRDLHPYDKFTDYPPEGADFVVYFLTDAESGICVHYASTATILLRMLGIPARYVEGYLDTAAGPNKTTDIYSTEGHAWFEFFDPEFGWIMGDPTPGNELPASHFNVDAVAATYPEMETDVFSVAPHGTNDPVPTASEAAIDTTDETDVGETTAETEETTVETTEETTEETTVETAETTIPSSTSEPEASTSVSYIDPSEQDTDEETTEDRHINIIFTPNDIGRTAIIALCVFVSFGAVRLIYVISWKVRFSVKDNRKKAIAYYHYFRFTGKLLGIRLPRKAVAVAEKAAFSNEDVSAEEIKLMVSVFTRSAKALGNKVPSYRRVPYRFFEIKV